MLNRPDNRFGGQRQIALLTNREVQCLQELANGLANAGIAKQLGISEPTVAMHICNARRKLGAVTRIQAVAIAVGQGIIHH